ncbi:MAG: Ig-like domain-containing protein [Methanobacteriota archaeon]
MKKFILMLIVGLLIVSQIPTTFFVTPVKGYSFSHTVLGEMETAWWCQYCKFAHQALQNIYAAGWYPFYYTSLETAKNKHAMARAVELGYGGLPRTFFDGGYRMDAGAPNLPTVQNAYNISIRECGNRTVANIDLELSVSWLGPATMEIEATAINNDPTPYQGHIRVYVTEIESTMGWKDSAGHNYTFAFLDYAINMSVTIPGGDSWSQTTVWDGHLFNDGYGHSFENITENNVMIIAAIFNSQTKLVDETTGATPGIVNNPPETPTPPTGPTQGLPGQEYLFTSVTTDPEGDDIFYFFDWGDGMNSSWVGPYSSGESGSASHTWLNSGTYALKAQAKDTDGHLSDWSSYSYLTLNTPPNKPNTPSPGNGSTGVDINILLSWLGGDPDAGDTVTYDVYFGTTPSPPRVSNNQSGTSYNPGTLSYSTVYYWRIIAWDNHQAKTIGPLWHFTTMAQPNRPPNIPSNPTPQNNSINIDINADLIWTGGDPDAGDTVTYDVYFGTVNPPTIKVSANQSSTTYNPGILAYSTTYYWKIIAWDNHQAKTSGPYWKFTTMAQPNQPPYTPSNPVPANGATDVNINTDLSWTGGDPDPGDTVTYDVYFGTVNPPPLVSPDVAQSTYHPGPLNHATTYYWKIVSKDNHGASTAGPVWHFTTQVPPNSPPYTPSSPNPSNGATSVDINADLSWTGGDPDPGDTVTYDVYFGTVNPPSSKVSANQSGTTYDPGTLTYSTVYYWKIIAWDTHNARTNGPVWSFTTGSQTNQPPYVPSNPAPANGAVDVDINADLSWTGGDPDPGDTVTYDVYFGTSIPPMLITLNHAGTTYALPGLQYEETYYWKIVSKDNHGASTTGPLWQFTTMAPPNNPPNTPGSPNPSNGETNVALSADISWTGGDPDAGDTVTYDVYFGTVNPPTTKVSTNQSGTTYDLGVLAYSTVYYWRIIAWDNHGAGTSGPVWQFTTRAPPSENQPPNTPNTPNPSNGAINISITPTLSWTGGDPDSGDTVTYSVYFGNTSPPPKVITNQSSTSYIPSSLKYNTTYYWRIIAWDNHGAHTSGPLWTFTTKIQTSNLQLRITKPEAEYIYRFDKQLRKRTFSETPLIIGKLTITVNATDNISGIKKVEFYIDGELKNTDNSSPYTWVWTDHTFSLHTVKVVAYNTLDKSLSTEIKVRKFF